MSQFIIDQIITLVLVALPVRNQRIIIRIKLIQRIIPEKIILFQSLRPDTNLVDLPLKSISYYTTFFRKRYFRSIKSAGQTPRNSHFLIIDKSFYSPLLHSNRQLRPFIQQISRRYCSRTAARLYQYLLVCTQFHRKIILPDQLSRTPGRRLQPHLESRLPTIIQFRNRKSRNFSSTTLILQSKIRRLGKNSGRHRYKRKRES